MNQEFKIIMHKEDIDNDTLASLLESKSIAVDSETLGLNVNRDRLCLLQLKGEDNNIHLVQFDSNKYEAPNLIEIFRNENIVKIYHFARFDIAIVLKFLGVLSNNNYCTKIASKIARTYTDKHGLKEICRELLGINLNKDEQRSYWGNINLTKEQQIYASNDVAYLHNVKEKLDFMLEREKRMPLAQACFSFVSSRALLDVLGYGDQDIFAHN